MPWGPTAIKILRLRPELGTPSDEETGGLLLDSRESQDALVIRRDRSERWIRYTSSAMPDRDGRPKAFVVVARDVTGELEADRLKSDFVAAVSHELRTPLTPLKGFLISLEQGIVDPEPDALLEYYGIMRRQAERLERLITDLLDVSLLGAGTFRLDAEDICLPDTLQEQIREAEQLPIGRPVAFVAPCEPVWVRADPQRVGQVITNLLSNAFKYSPPDARIEATLTVSEGYAQVSVYNEGEGVPARDQERLFDRFYRADSAITRMAGGVGLGLHISKKLVEAMGGRIWCESAPGQGCTFSLTLPLVEMAGVQPPASGQEFGVVRFPEGRRVAMARASRVG